MKRQVAWCVPFPSKGSGGFRTITQNARALELAGFETTFCFLPNPIVTSFGNDLRNDLKEWFGYEPRFIELNCTDLQKNFDLIIATQWDTAAFVARQNARHKAYFIQDFEPYFYPVGTEYLLAEESYRLGLTPITIGKWLQTKCSIPYGHPSLFTPFGADPNIYHPIHCSKKHAICAICQQEKPRRATRLLLDAIEIALALDDKLVAYLFGSTAAPQTNNDRIKHLGLLSTAECNDLYNRCEIGISMGTTNPSRIPFEMMAAGLPVIDMYGENNLFDLPNNAATLAHPSSDAIATAILDLVNDPNRLRQMSLSGLDYMKNRTLEIESSCFVKACLSLVDGAAVETNQEIAALQHRCVCADETCRKSLINLERTRQLDLKREAAPLGIPNKELFVLLEGEETQNSTYSVACWSDANQSDLVWAELKKHDSNKLIGSLELHAAGPNPRLYHLHIYQTCPSGEAPVFMFGIDKAIYLREGADESSPSVKPSSYSCKKSNQTVSLWGKQKKDDSQEKSRYESLGHRLSILKKILRRT